MWLYAKGYSDESENDDRNPLSNSFHTHTHSFPFQAGGGIHFIFVRFGSMRLFLHGKRGQPQNGKRCGHWVEGFSV